MVQQGILKTGQLIAVLCDGFAHPARLLLGSHQNSAAGFRRRLDVGFAEVAAIHDEAVDPVAHVFFELETLHDFGAVDCVASLAVVEAGMKHFMRDFRIEQRQAQLLREAAVFAFASFLEFDALRDIRNGCRVKQDRLPLVCTGSAPMEKVSDFRLTGAEADEEVAELPIYHRCIEGKKVFANPVLEASCNQTSILDLSNDAGDENQGFQRTKTRPQVFEQRVLPSELPYQRANTDIVLGEAAFRRSTLLDFLDVFRRSQTFASLGGRLLQQRSRHVAALEEAAVFGIGIVAAVDHAVVTEFRLLRKARNEEISSRAGERNSNLPIYQEYL